MRGRSRSTSESTKYLRTLAMAFALVMGIACCCSCDEPDEPMPVNPVNPVNPNPPTPPVEKDTMAPEITLKLSEFNVYGGKVAVIGTGKLSIGETEAATWRDDKSAADKCTVALSFAEADTKATTEATTQAETGTDNAPDTKAETKAGTTIKSGDTLDKAGTLTITVTDEAGNKAEKGITLTATLSYSSIAPAKANIYPEFNNQNVEAHKREGTYEMLALASKCILPERRAQHGLKVIMQSPGYKGAIQKYNNNYNAHEEECYRNLSDGTGDTENIYAVRDKYTEIETYLNSGERNDKNVMYSTSNIKTTNTDLEKLNQNPHYQALIRLGQSDYFLGNIANGNANETDRDYQLSDDITDTSPFPEGGYEYSETAPAKNDNNIQAVVCGYAKDKIIFQIYDNNGASSSCPLISKDSEIFVRCCSPFPTEDYNTLNADWGDYTWGNTSYATPALTAQWKNIYDVCHPLGIIGNMTELKALITKYAREVPCFIWTKDAEGKITEEPSGYGLVTNAVPIIEQEVIPTIVSKCVSTDEGTTLLYKDDVFRIAYQGAGVEYQAADGSWNDTSGVPVSEYVDKPQRISPALQQKYGIASSASASASSSSSGTGSKVTIHLLTAEAEQIINQEVTIP